jgi:hypothetical protein
MIAVPPTMYKEVPQRTEKQQQIRQHAEDMSLMLDQ